MRENFASLKRIYLLRGKLVPSLTSSLIRSLIVVLLVVTFLFYPWRISGPVAYDASDPRLVYVTPNTSGGAVFDSSARQVSLQANMTSGPRLDFISSESSFVFSTDLVIVKQTKPPPGGWPGETIDSPSAVIFKLWHPGSAGQALLGFRILDEVSGRIFFEVLYNGVAAYNETIANYVVGERFHLTSTWIRLSSIGFSLSNDSGLSFVWSGANGSAIRGVADLTRRPILDLSASPQGQAFVSTANFCTPVYDFPGNGRFASFTGDSLPFLVSLVILVAIVTLQWPEEKRLAKKLQALLRSRPSQILQFLENHTAALIILLASAFIYALVAISFGGLPFDNIVFKTWVYGAQIGGLQGLYGRTSSVGDSFIRPDQIPYYSLGFAYLPLAAYLMLIISIILPSSAVFQSQVTMFQSAALEAQIKFILSCFTLITGAIVYAVVLRSTGNKRRALVAMSLFLLNPAIVYDSAVWGETDAVLYFALFVFAYLAAQRRFLALTLFPFFLAFKQTGVLLVFPVALITFMPGSKVRDLVSLCGRASSILFGTMLPLLIGGVLPSALSTPLVQKLLDIGTPLGAESPPVSPDTYTLWTGLSAFSGLSGIQRLHVPSDTPIIWGVSANVLGYIVLIPLLVTTFLILRPRIGNADPSFWYGIMAFLPIALTTVLTGASSRYYTLAIPGLVGVIALAWDRLSMMERKLALATTVLVSLISLWTMAGIFTWIMSHDLQSIRGLEPSSNPLMALVNRFYLNDAIITLGSAAAMIAFLLSTILILSLARPHPLASGSRRKTNPLQAL